MKVLANYTIHDENISINYDPTDAPWPDPYIFTAPNDGIILHAKGGPGPQVQFSYPDYNPPDDAPSWWPENINLYAYSSVIEISEDGKSVSFGISVSLNTSNAQYEPNRVYDNLTFPIHVSYMEQVEIPDPV